MNNLIITEHAHKHGIKDEVAEKIVEEVYDAIDRGAYKVITDKVRKTPTITIPNEEIKKKLLQEIQNA